MSDDDRDSHASTNVSEHEGTRCNMALESPDKERRRDGPSSGVDQGRGPLTIGPVDSNLQQNVHRTRTTSQPQTRALAAGEHYDPNDPPILVKDMLRSMTAEVRQAFTYRSLPLFLLYIIVVSLSVGLSYLSSEDKARFRLTTGVSNNLMHGDDFQEIQSPGEFYEWLSSVTEALWGVTDEDLTRRQNTPLEFLIIRQHRIDPTSCDSKQAGPISSSIRPNITNKCYKGYDRSSLAQRFTPDQPVPQYPAALVDVTSDPYQPDRLKPEHSLPYLKCAYGFVHDYTDSEHQYTLLLPYNSMSTAQVTDVITHLSDNGWVDVATRFVQVSTLLYNAPLDLYLHVSYTLEFTRVGAVSASPRVKPFWLFIPSERPLGPFLLFADIFLAVYTLCILKELVRQVKVNIRLKLPLVGFWESLMCVHVCLLVSYLVVRFLVWHKGNKVHNNLAAVELYDDLTSYLHYFDISRTVFAAALWIGYMRLMEYLRYNGKLNAVSETIRLASTDLLSLFVICGYIIVCFAIVANTLYGWHFEAFATVTDSITSLIFAAFEGGVEDYQEMLLLERFWTPIFVFSYLLLSWMVLLNVVLGILATGFEAASKSTVDRTWSVRALKNDARALYMIIRGEFFDEESDEEATPLLSVEAGQGSNSEGNNKNLHESLELKATDPYGAQNEVFVVNTMDNLMSMSPAVPANNPLGPSGTPFDDRERSGSNNSEVPLPVKKKKAKFMLFGASDRAFAKSMACIEVLVTKMKEARANHRKEQKALVKAGLIAPWEVAPFDVDSVTTTCDTLAQTNGWKLDPKETGKVRDKADDLVPDSFAQAEEEKKREREELLRVISESGDRVYDGIEKAVTNITDHMAEKVRALTDRVAVVDESVQAVREAHGQLLPEVSKVDDNLTRRVGDLEGVISKLVQQQSPWEMRSEPDPAIANNKAALEKQRSELEQQRKELAALEKQRAQLEKQSNDAGDRERSELDKQLEKQRKELADIENQRSELEKQRTELADIDEQRNELEKQRKELAYLEKQRTKFEKHGNDSDRERSELEKQRSELEKQRQELADIEKQRDELEKERKELAELEKKRAEFEQQSKEVGDRERSQLEKRQDEFKTQQEKLEKQRDELEKKRAELAELEKERKEVAEKASQLATWEDSLRNWEKSLEDRVAPVAPAATPDPEEPVEEKKTKKKSGNLFDRLHKTQIIAKLPEGEKSKKERRETKTDLGTSFNPAETAKQK
ncbi:Polycystin-2 [Diplonema papillatum]|nr:Polycystin-2 [Diplonema papillatum]